MKKLNLIFILSLTIVCLFSTYVYAQEASLPPEDNRGSTNSTLFPANTPDGVNQPNAQPSYSEESARAQSAALEARKSFEQTAVSSDSQAAAWDKRSQKESDQKFSQGFQTATAEVLGCSAGQILGNITASLVNGLIQQGLNFVSNLAEKIVTVPTVESGQTLLNSKTQTNAQTGTTVGAFGIGVIVLPSWDSIAYCVVNAMITYVANSTIAWVQGGFEGNPSFVNNPEEFFKDLANVEANAFLQELAYGVTGLNICEPFRIQIVLSIARNHVSGQQGYGGNLGYSQGGFNQAGGNLGYGGCSLDDIAGNLQGFLRGDFARGGWESWFKISQVDSNNPYSTFFNLQAQLQGAVQKKQNIARVELNWGNGFLSFRKCEEDTPESEKGNCPITSPGAVIQGQLEKTLGLPKDRLVLAQKFDQVIAVVVNQLVQVALDKVLETVQE